MNKQRGFWNSVRDLWKKGKTGVALFIHSILVIVHTYFAIGQENQNTWKGYESFQNVFVDISRFIPVALAYTGIIIGGIDIIMLLSDWYANRKQQQIEAAKQSGKAEGKAEGRQELLEELKASGVDVSKVESKPKE